ncbi:hypothetical protein CI109_101332 [Kwoniella shandongensis]|uniref:Uncharacterized protein n=1 Tax=Kwoniella shandongensis TaxID=1734106 RepID=A0A5M6BUC9_9TREE|nr:uncharacterized protein CI109_005289 [Kwoniella shandongensis]KAA5526333.1 hypothetical protein CI109_005289 [Kwoniella shandongensis]
MDPEHCPSTIQPSTDFNPPNSIATCASDSQFQHLSNLETGQSAKKPDNFWSRRRFGAPSHTPTQETSSQDHDHSVACNTTDKGKQPVYPLPAYLHGAPPPFQASHVNNSYETTPDHDPTFPQSSQHHHDHEHEHEHEQEHDNHDEHDEHDQTLPLIPSKHTCDHTGQPDPSYVKGIRRAKIATYLTLAATAGGIVARGALGRVVNGPGSSGSSSV